MNRSVKNLAEIFSTATDLLAFRYPPFVYGLDVSSIPVFCLHQAESIPLESMLDFLSTNGYATLTADEYLSVLVGDAAPPGRAVVLSFDDGWGSLWTIGFPLFKRYDMKCVVFIPPGRITEFKNRWHNLDDLDNGRCRPEEVLGRDQSSHPLLTWDEIVEMHASGLVDFQSHSYTHSLIRTETRIVDFIHPDLLNGFNMLEFPVTSGRSVRLGEPLYSTASRLSDARALIGGEAVSAACIDHVGRNGAEAFFRRPRWRNELLELSRSTKGEEWIRETPEEQRKAIRFELSASRRELEERLPGKLVRHMCFPWHVMGRQAFEETKRVDYSGCFMGKVGGRYCAEIPGNPESIPRLGGDFFFRLPGAGRVSLSKILIGKAARRAKQGSPYLTH